MIKKLKLVELEYIRCFAVEKNFNNVIVFIDEKFKNTYTSNITVLCRYINDDELIKTINREFKLYIKKRKSFLNFEVNENLSEQIVENLIEKPNRIDKFDYMVIESREYKNIEIKERAEIKLAKSKEEFNDFMDINIKDNAPILGKGYAIKKLNRKVQVYNDDSNKLKAFICYKDGVAVGSCEVLLFKDICKIEDFSIVKEHRNKGLGTYFISEILKYNYERGIKYTYLITETNGRSKKLYKKLGFSKVGEKTQLIW